MTQPKQTRTPRRSEPAAGQIDGPPISLAVIEQIVETGQLGFARVDVASGRFLAANSRFCAMLSYAADELAGSRINFREIIYPGDLDRCAKQLKRLLAGEIDAFTLEKRYFAKDRSVVPVRTTAMTLERSRQDGSVLSVGVVSVPAGQRPGALPHDAGKPHGASLWTYDFVTKTGNCSDGFKILLGRAADGPIPPFREAMAQVHPDDRARVLQDVLRVRKGLAQTSEFRIVRQNGELRWVSQTVTPKVDFADKVVGVVSGCLDITDAKQIARHTPSANTVRAVKQYVDMKWNQPLSVTNLAQAAGVNTRTLFKHFKQDFGFTPQEYIKRVRLNHARAMLLTADRSTTVLGIALKCCFQNQGHFARDYRMAFSERPSDTLERARRGEEPGR